MTTRSEQILIAALKGASAEDPLIDRALAQYLRSKDIDVEGIPRYTNSLNAALGFARALDPRHAGAVSWGSSCKAKINDGPTGIGANSAIAVCLAALLSLGSADSQ